ncbi:cobalamin biosynthesis protein [Aquisalimonas sp. 2447]|uniref:adenosylcobinamide-phosphate synthase CbiB n=1 Tax=Aquisalimonas sp. 2447 TaxID=2740807 RepID=UPI0014324AE3|nr:adenosylcobinamide-phosphate synthase CbiB [Aquisalimonas sp. 2447]QIT57062.1 cobalamin biosynthesis protein [Aquisalimonas sp. 2447]
MLIALVCIAAVLLDAALGEPRRGHPLVAFGNLVGGVERCLNHPGRAAAGRGVLAALVLVVPPVALAWGVIAVVPLPLVLLLEALVLYLALGLRSLTEHARAVAAPLSAGDLTGARTAVGALVSRDTGQLEDSGVAVATVESVLENGADAVFASLFWFIVAGVPGVILHRLVNTLDAMWGYRTARYHRFGWFVARLDDVLNWIPARLTALSYALVGQTASAWRCWRSQAAAWDSPNAGPVMAAGAGALGVTLGGDAPYHGGWKKRPRLGTGPAPAADAIAAAIRLVRRAVMLWLVLIAVGGGLWALTTAGG